MAPVFLRSDVHVDLASVQPAMEEMAVIDQDYNQAGDTAASQLAVVAKAIPVLISAMSLSMPCKEMCNAVVDTCGTACLPGPIGRN